MNCSKCVYESLSVVRQPCNRCSPDDPEFVSKHITKDGVKDAMRYRWLRSRSLTTIHDGGVFAGVTPDNIVLNGDDLDSAIDKAIQKERRGAGD